MERLTDQGWQKVLDLSQRYGVSTDAVSSLLQSVVNGNGSMAQFYHPELGGGGQWMQGGMTMVGDMFNYGLKSKVDGLCTELSQLLRTQPFVPRPAPTSGSGGMFMQGGSGSWWPSELGSPNGSGGQNNVRYAYFSNARRLAVDVNGTVTVYDTLDHNIGGVQQQQGGNSSVTLSSQYGTIDVSSLPVISINGVKQLQPGNGGSNSSSNFNSNFNSNQYSNQSQSQSPPAPQYNPPAPQYNPPAPQYNPPPPPPAASFTPLYAAPGASPAAGASNGGSLEADVFAKIERLAELQQKGILSSEEFSAKKTELLSRL